MPLTGTYLLINFPDTFYTTITIFDPKKVNEEKEITEYTGL